MIEGQQVLPPIDSLDGIHAAVKRMALPVDSFWDAYQTMSLEKPVMLNLDSGRTHAIQVPYRVGGLEFEARTAFRKGR